MSWRSRTRTLGRHTWAGWGRIRRSREDTSDARDQVRDALDQAEIVTPEEPDELRHRRLWTEEERVAAYKAHAADPDHKEPVDDLYRRWCADELTREAQERGEYD